MEAGRGLGTRLCNGNKSFLVQTHAQVKIVDEEPDDPSFTPRDDTGQKEKAGFKPSSMVDMKPCEDLHRYVVDKFHATTKWKPVLFEEIDLSTYKSTAKVASFLTSEDRLLL